MSVCPQVPTSALLVRDVNSPGHSKASYSRALSTDEPSDERLNDGPDRLGGVVLAPTQAEGVSWCSEMDTIEP